MKVKKASSFFFWLLRGTLGPVIRRKYNFKFDRKNSTPINPAKLKRPCIILSNHQTMADQFSVTQGFRFGINYVANDAIFRKGLASKLMVALTNPIPISKGTADASAVRMIFSCVRKGGSVAIFPSGNTSWFGDECTINPSIAKMCKKLNVPVVLVRQTGGYMTRPRWRAKHAISKGKFRAAVTRIISPEELQASSADEIFSMIQAELCHDEFAWNQVARVEFKGKHKAEYLESALFWCPKCHSFENLRSEGNDFFCTACNARVTINHYGFFDSTDASLPQSILVWGKLQLDYIKSFDFSPYRDKPVCCDDHIALSLIHRTKSEESLGTGQIALYNDRITVCGKDIAISEIQSFSISFVSKLTIYTAENAYCIAVPPRTNLFKYMVCGYRLKQLGDNQSEDFYGY